MQEIDTKEPNGSWFCMLCKKAVKIKSVSKNNDSYIFETDCEHVVVLSITPNDVVFLTHEEQRQLAKAFLIAVLEELGDGEILVVNAKNAMSEHTGLDPEECYKIITKGIEEGWVIETQKLILDKITGGDLKLDLTIE